MGSQDRLGWGFIGASTIADEWMIDAVNAHADSRVVAIASRSAERADALGQRHGIQRHDGVAARAVRCFNDAVRGGGRPAATGRMASARWPRRWRCAPRRPAVGARRFRRSR